MHPNPSSYHASFGPGVGPGVVPGVVPGVGPGPSAVATSCPLSSSPQPLPTTFSPDSPYRRYLAIIPRGMEHATTDALRNGLVTRKPRNGRRRYRLRRIRCHRGGYSCGGTRTPRRRCGGTDCRRGVDATKDEGETDELLCDGDGEGDNGRDGDDEEELRQLREKLLSSQRKKDRKRRAAEAFRQTSKEEKNGGDDNDDDDDHRHHDQVKDDQKPSSSFATPRPVGTVQCLDGTAELNFGYHCGIGIGRGHKRGIEVTSAPGPLEGTSLLHFETDAPSSVVSRIRGLGTGCLLALVASSYLTQHDEQQYDEKDEKGEREKDEQDQKQAQKVKTKSESNCSRSTNDRHDGDGAKIDNDDDDGSAGGTCKVTAGSAASRVLRFDQTLNESKEVMRRFVRGAEREQHEDTQKHQHQHDEEKSKAKGHVNVDSGTCGAGTTRFQSYVEQFRKAVSLWHEHAKDVWYGQDDYYGLGLVRAESDGDVNGSGDGGGNGNGNGNGNDDNYGVAVTIGVGNKDDDVDGDKNANAERAPKRQWDADADAERARRRQEVDAKLAGTVPFSYRVSCVRSHTSKYNWKRDDAMPFLADLIVPYRELSGRDLTVPYVPSLSLSSSSAPAPTPVPAPVDVVASSAKIDKVRDDKDDGDGCNDDDDDKDNNHNRRMNESDDSPFADRGASDASSSTNDAKGGKGEGNNDQRRPQSRLWNVNLVNYDLEILALIHHDAFIIAIPLRPYRHLRCRSYGRGTLAPDVSPPYIPGDTSSMLIRLRPSAASALLRLANVRPGDVVLDPFAGVGTIPLEAALLDVSASIVPGGEKDEDDDDDAGGSGRGGTGDGGGCFGIGGDVAIGSSGGAFARVAADYASAVRGAQLRPRRREAIVITEGEGGDKRAEHLAAEVEAEASGGATRVGGAADAPLAWDAALLPVRSGSVDAIVSDLPFGVKCLSSAKLSRLLPLAFGECARVLRPCTGRMVLLCGAFRTVLDALEEQNRADEDVEEKEEVDGDSNSNADGIVRGKGDAAPPGCRRRRKRGKTKDVFRLPALSVFPVNVGGLTAWVVIVERGNDQVSPMGSRGRERVKKMAASRKRVEESRAGSEKKAILPSTKRNGKAKLRRAQEI